MTSNDGLGGGGHRALFLDRDGVINVDHGYVHRIEEFDFIDGVFDLVRAARERSFLPVVVTNQSGIARGMYGEGEFHALTAWMMGQFATKGAPIERVYHCPFHRDAVVERYRRDHRDRKPGPGMFLSAARELDIDLSASVMIGDRWSDAVAAAAAGVTEIVLVGDVSTIGGKLAVPVRRVSSVREAAALFWAL